MRFLNHGEMGHFCQCPPSLQQVGLMQHGTHAFEEPAVVEQLDHGQYAMGALRHLTRTSRRVWTQATVLRAKDLKPSIPSVIIGKCHVVLAMATKAKRGSLYIRVGV